ncbi:transferase [Talaromyces proteolyticus]|uniref:Transferase n=1 Tax=Talaromyces proteolyticus TaxID=1131652 RepID=A0AAD4PST3_9EURO|nr:transferase [Talaromyces proteolyticus]KAH8689593.1 transferase [Talaromyces proteolyticus]
MPKKEVLHIHPFGWETDPEEERYKVTTLDYLTACTYTHYTIFFRLDDADKPKAIDVLKAGLERTLSQTRHLCGTIEKDPAGGHSFVKKKDGTVQFVVQWLDAPEDKSSYPSIDDLEEAHFRSTRLGNLDLWSIPPMAYGEKEEAHPDNSPVTAAFMVNLIRGGLVLIIHQHHYANDVMGWSGLTHQLAENCKAIFNNTAFPTWDPSCLDLSRLIKAEVPEGKKIDGPPTPERHPDHRGTVALLFHLPKSKAAELKRLASPTDDTWISTYDAFSAFIWRTVSRLRAPIFKPDLSQPLFWSEAVDMRRRMHSPKVAPRIQQNVMFAALSPTAPVPQPTAAEVISEWSLSQLASYIRKLTNSVTQENLDQALSVVATVRDKTAMNIRINAHPPMSILQTDHREANITAADFGFGRPLLYRHPMGDVTEGVFIVYPPRAGAGPDEGSEFSITYEKELAQTLIEDPEWKKYFEYRGVEAGDTLTLPN